MDEPTLHLWCCITKDLIAAEVKPCVLIDYIFDLDTKSAINKYSPKDKGLDYNGQAIHD